MTDRIGVAKGPIAFCHLIFQQNLIYTGCINQSEHF